MFWKAVNEKAYFPVVVLYTGESCAFCQVASHVFQTLKGLISSELVEFVSVDASANDLPWAFTALAVPSVLYFHPSSSTSSKPKAATHTTASSAATFSIWILLRIKYIFNYLIFSLKLFSFLMLLEELNSLENQWIDIWIEYIELELLLKIFKKKCLTSWKRKKICSIKVFLFNYS